ncbi:MAG TPA: hypothetical protein VKA09_09630 [Nitrososphaeraceae archaeon]|nr:hypothetical protein [Nitrososphaeraceae archaeon]
MLHGWHYQVKSVSHPTEPAPISVLFGGFSRKYLISADGFHNNEVDANRLVHSFIIFLAFVEEQERTLKPIFGSVLVKWHSL